MDGPYVYITSLDTNMILLDIDKNQDNNENTALRSLQQVGCTSMLPFMTAPDSNCIVTFEFIIVT